MQKKQSTIATVVYLITNNTICLAKKKEDIHVGKEKLKKSKSTWNGYGGKREEEDMSIRDTAIRELKQESGVDASPHNLIPMGRIGFFWDDNTTKTPNMDVYFFFLGTWIGKPDETEEMGKPTFFTVDTIPYHEMMPGDRVFLKEMLENKKIVANVYLGKKDKNGTPFFEYRNEELIV